MGRFRLFKWLNSSKGEKLSHRRKFVNPPPSWRDAIKAGAIRHHVHMNVKHIPARDSSAG